MAELIDGKALAKEVRAEVKARAEAFRATHNRAPGLDVVLVGDDPASQVYVRNKERAAAKAGIDGRVHRLASGDLRGRPPGPDLRAQRRRPHRRDSRAAAAARSSARPDHRRCHRPGQRRRRPAPVQRRPPRRRPQGLRPCTPSGCMRMLEHVGCDPKGKRALVLGRSTLVGKPIALMLLEKHATVTIAHSRTETSPTASASPTS